MDRTVDFIVLTLAATGLAAVCASALLARNAIRNIPHRWSAAVGSIVLLVFGVLALLMAYEGPP